MYDDYATMEKGICAQAVGGQLGQYQPPTARRQLEQKKAALLGELTKIEAALSALDKHPELEAFTETLKAALR